MIIVKQSANWFVGTTNGKKFFGFTRYEVFRKMCSYRFKQRCSQHNAVQQS